MADQNTQTLIIEFYGEEEAIQKLLEKLEAEAEGAKVEIKAVTIRKD